MKMQTGKEMLAYLFKYHVYQHFKTDEHKTNLNMATYQLDKRWNIVNGSSIHSASGYWNDLLSFALTSYQYL